MADRSLIHLCSHPVALFFLFLFRCLAIATYLLCGFFVSSYVFSVSGPGLRVECCAWPLRS